MKISFKKQPGGILVPSSDIEADRMNRFKTGEDYEVEIKLTRNSAFHGKVFAFFNFCFTHWRHGNEYQDEAKQFNVFRAHLTALAGYFDSFVGIDGRVRVEAKSISYSNMTQEEFEHLYSALINAAIKNIDWGMADENTLNQLYNFF